MVLMIDNKTVEQARNADMIDFLQQRHGFTFARQGGTYRCREHPSLAVKGDRVSWYWHSRAIGGFGALDYLIKAENLRFREAVEAVTGIAPAAAPPPQQNAEPPKKLILPEKRGIPLRLYDYLCCKRGIDSRIVDALMHEKKLYEDKRGNIVFVGYDETGKARFASLRGAYGDCRFRMDCAGSDKRYGFHIGASAPSERLYIFESAIDAMSHGSLVNAEFGDTTAWKYDCRLSLSGTSDVALSFFLNQHPTVKELVFCLDNDAPGREAAVTLARKYTEKGFWTRLELPSGKDFNDDLQAIARQLAAERRAKPQQRRAAL